MLNRGFIIGFISSIGKALLRTLPDSDIIYRFCKKFIDQHNGGNNDDMVTNGKLCFIKEVLPRANIIFDVGANIGDWTKHALLINPKAQFYCFEPSVTAYRLLVANKFSANVTVNNFGLGESRSEMPLFIYGDKGSINSLYKRHVKGAFLKGQETVQIETLDDYCKKEGIDRIDFMKLDVEGHELSVLQGGKGLLAQGRIGIIQFEYGGTYIDARVFLKDIWEYVSDINLDYTFYKIYPDGIRLVSAYWYTLENFQYSNWVIINKDWKK